MQQGSHKGLAQGLFFGERSDIPMESLININKY